MAAAQKETMRCPLLVNCALDIKLGAQQLCTKKRKLVHWCIFPILKLHQRAVEWQLDMLNIQQANS